MSSPSNDSDQDQDPAKGDARKQRQRRKPSIVGWLFGLLFSTGVAIALCAGAWLWWSVHRTVDPGTEAYRIATGSNLARFGDELVDRKVIPEAWSLRIWARLTDKSRKIKAGTYMFEGPMRAVDILDKLVTGDVLSHKVSFIEGWRFRQWRAALARADGLVQTLEGLPADVIMTRLDLPGVHPEGRFFPDTYTYEEGSKDIDILRRAYDRMSRTLADEWAARDPSIPLKSADEALILASIIEKETGAAEERARIAGVFVNRINRGMLLQTDPTVIYGLGEEFDGNLTRKHLRTDGPYNTYKRKGLTPTPIAMPGKDAIHAALHPEETDEVYFVSRGDGTHQFSRTLKEHNAAVRKYQLKRKSK